MIKLEHYLYFIAVWKHGSINKAANHLFLSQPYLSTTLKELETLLETQLLVRHSKGVQLTKAGEQFLDDALAIEAIMTRTLAMRSKACEPEEKLKIIAFYAYTLLDVYSAFTRLPAYENLSIQYEEMQNYAVLETFVEKAADIGIFYYSSTQEATVIDKLKTLSLDFECIHEGPVYIVVSHLHPLFTCKTVSVEELTPYTALMESIKLSDLTRFGDANPLYAYKEHLNFEASQFSNNRSLLYHLSKSDKYYTFGQYTLNTSNPFVLTGELKYIPVEGLAFDLKTAICYSPDSTNTMQSAYILALKKALHDLREDSND